MIAFKAKSKDFELKDEFVFASEVADELASNDISLNFVDSEESIACCCCCCCLLVNGGDVDDQTCYSPGTAAVQLVERKLEYGRSWGRRSRVGCPTRFCGRGGSHPVVPSLRVLIVVRGNR